VCLLSQYQWLKEAEEKKSMATDGPAHACQTRQMHGMDAHSGWAFISLSSRTSLELALAKLGPP
jgi:hypothetical protein